tara:strand:+ start:334 stop:1011 length:678 start_codon:yes stop_codon:yes gene_type:complete
MNETIQQIKEDINVAEGKCDILYNDEPEELKPLTDDEMLKLSKSFTEQSKVKYNLIKNPFVCRSDFEVRVSLDKDPRKNKGNTDYLNLYETDEGAVHLVNELDSRSSYEFGKVAPNKYKEMSIINKYDYDLSAEFLNEKRTDGKELHKDPLPLSFIQISNEKDGALWYKMNYPRIPDDLIPIIARYHWGEPITKKGLKNEKKKIIKKEAKQNGMEVRKGNFKVSF